MRQMKAGSLADLVRMATKLEPILQKPRLEIAAAYRPQWSAEEAGACDLGARPYAAAPTLAPDGDARAFTFGRLMSGVLAFHSC